MNRNASDIEFEKHLMNVICSKYTHLRNSENIEKINKICYNR